MADFKRLEVFNLWSTPDKFWIESSKVKTTQLLQITRDGCTGTASISMEPHMGQIPSTASKKAIYGILGIANLPLGQVLIVITRRINVGEVRSVNVWQLDSCELIPIRWKASGTCEPLQLEANRKCLSLLSETLATPYFYFSYNGDITNTLQRLNDQPAPTSGSGQGREAWERLDKRFVWNENLLRPFLEVMAGANDLQPFLTPIIHGAVFIRKMTLNRKPFVWAVITRRSKFRTGTRFFVRGADRAGNAANFNETEQIVEVKGLGITSYVQTRGSMPYMWTQIPNIRYKPKPVVVGSVAESQMAFDSHFTEQKRIYGVPQVDARK